MRIKLFSFIPLFALVYFAVLIAISWSCRNQGTKEPPPVDTEIIDLWDNGLARKVWVYSNINGTRTATKEIQYHPNGKKSMEGSLKDGLRHGEWKSWYENGNLWSVGTFANGLRHGKGVVYHPNGKKFIEGTYINGERAGTWMWWDENGQVITEIEALRLAPEMLE
jgi:hypothetical protein